MRIYSFPHYVVRPRVRVLRVRRRGLGNVLAFFLALGASFWIIRSSPFEMRENMRDAASWASAVGKAVIGDEAPARETTVLLPPQHLTSAPASRGGEFTPIYGRDDRRFVPYGNGIDTLSSRVGKSTTLRALSFDQRALLRCEHRCEVQFRDHFGRSVTGVFFRGAHADKLLASRGKVTITGLVQQAPDQSYVLYIQRVL